MPYSSTTEARKDRALELFSKLINYTKERRRKGFLMTKRKFFIQGLTITGISLFLRLLNIGYRSFISQKIGAEGMGLYQLVFSIFMLAVTLSTSGISLAVTRLVTGAIIAGKRDTIRSVVHKCFFFCLLLSLTIAFLLFTFSDFAAAVLLSNARAAPCLRILAVGLPFMSICTCMKGYFLAVDESVSTAVSDVLEQVLGVAITVFLFWYIAPKSIEAACYAVMFSSTLGEIISFIFGMIAYRQSLNRNTPKERHTGFGILHGLTHIALPCTLSSAARSVLNTGENLLIPRELQKFGRSYSVSMAEYGLLQGMTMPMLYFPVSFLVSFASLLIPKISMAREQNHKKTISYVTSQALSSTLVFGVFFSAVFIAFADSWSTAFYRSEAAGHYLCIMAPLVPLAYLDIVIDSLLKGMDEQFTSMKFNLADSFLRVVLVICFLRFFGISSYIYILFFSTIFNVTLSLSRILKVTAVKFNLLSQLVLPGISVLLAVFLSSYYSKIIISHVAVLQIPLTQVLFQTLFSAVLYLVFYRIILSFSSSKYPSLFYYMRTLYK